MKFIIVAFLLLMPVLAYSQEPPKASSVTNSITLTADDLKPLDDLKATAQQDQQRDKEAQDAILNSRSDVEILAAAYKLRDVRHSQTRTDELFKRWMQDVKSKHQCPLCTVSNDLKSLLKPEEPKKEEVKK